MGDKPIGYIVLMLIKLLTYEEAHKWLPAILKLPPEEYERFHNKPEEASRD